MSAKVASGRGHRSFPRFTDRLLLNGALQVSPFCLGFVRDPSTVSHAFDQGINFFFVTADMHWPVYDGLRRGLAELFARGKSVRDEVVVAVVAYVTQPEFCHAPFREVIEAIPGLGHVDVTVAGGSYEGDFAARAPQFAQHGPLGARAFGTSFHDRRLAARALKEGLVDIGFVRYNSDHRGAEEDVFRHVGPRSAERRALLYNFTTTFGFVPPGRYAELGLGSGHWKPSITEHYRFVLDRPEIDGVLCAPQTPEEVDSLASALARGPLSDEEIAYLRDLSDLSQGRASLT